MVCKPASSSGSTAPLANAAMPRRKQFYTGNTFTTWPPASRKAGFATRTEKSSDSRGEHMCVMSDAQPARQCRLRVKPVS